MKTCRNQIIKEREQKKKAKNGKGPGPRVAWHGEYFREKFYQATLPDRYRQLPANEPGARIYTPRLTLFAAAVHDRDTRSWLAEALQEKIFLKI